MNEQQTPAASSPAEVQDVFRGERISVDEYSRYRQDGTLPDRFKPAANAESDPADAPEEPAVSEPEEGESESESEPDESQEKPLKASGAEKRIKQLLAKVKELERAQQATAQKDVTPAPSAAQTAPQQQYTRPKPTAEDKTPDGAPKYATYEDFVEELADWKAEQRWSTAQREQQAQAQAQSLKAKVDEARSKHEDFDEVIAPFVGTFVSDQRVAPVVKQMINDSEVFTDLVFTLAGDDKFMAIAQSDPGKAIRYVAKVEGEILGERSAGDKPKAESTPAPPKTQAPKPPSPVGGTSSRGFDVSDESLSTAEWMRKRNAQIAKRNG